MATESSPFIPRDGLLLYLDAASRYSFRGEPTTNTVNHPSASANRYNNPGFSGGIVDTGDTFLGSKIWEVTFIPQDTGRVPRLGSTEGFGFMHGMGVAPLANTNYMASVYFKTDYPLVSTASQGFINTYSNIPGWGFAGTSTTRFKEDGWTRLYTRYNNTITIGGEPYSQRGVSNTLNAIVNTTQTTQVLFTVTLQSNGTFLTTTDYGSSAVGGTMANFATMVGLRSANPSITNAGGIVGLSTGTSAIVNHGLDTTSWTKLSDVNTLLKTSLPSTYYVLVNVPSTGGVNRTISFNLSMNGFYTSVSDNKYWKVTFDVSNLQVNDVIRTYWAAPMIEQHSRLLPSKFVIGTRGTTVAAGGGWANLMTDNYHGEIPDGIFGSKDNNGILSLDGVSNYIDLNNGIWGSTFTNTVGANYSIRCVIRPKAIGTNQAIVSQRHGDAVSLYLMDNGKVTFEIDDTNTRVGTNTVLQNNNWYDITVVFFNNTSSSFVEYYVNGIFERSETKWDSNGTSINNNLWIGWQSRTDYGINPTFFNGDIALVQIYNRAITRGEVYRNFVSTRSRFGI